MAVQDFSKYEKFLRTFLNSKLTSYDAAHSEDKPARRIVNENQDSFIITNDEIIFESFENIKRPAKPTLQDIVNSLNARYITFQLCNDEEDEFQKSTVYENIFPHELNSVILDILNSTEQY